MREILPQFALSTLKCKKTGLYLVSERRILIINTNFQEVTESGMLY